MATDGVFTSPPAGDPRVRAAFDRAADYDRHARVQRHAALALADRIAALPLRHAPAVLEIGCGTGLLTQALAPRLAGDWLATDVAPAMIARAAARLGTMRGIRTAIFDGASADPAIGRFDLVCSNFAFQWFADLPGAIARLVALLRPGGMLAFTTLADGSLDEWRRAHRVATGMSSALPDYPSSAGLAGMAPGGLPVRIETEYFHERGPARAFLASLQAIGAHRPRTPRAPMPPALLRRAMGAFDAAGGGWTWHVAYGLIGPVPAIADEGYTP